MSEQTVVRKSLLPPMSMWVTAYITTWIVKILSRIARRLLNIKVNVYNRDAVPMDGPVLQVGGHYSESDAFFWGATCPRNGAMLAKHDLWYNPVSGSILFWRGDIAVKRHKPKGRARALKKAKNVLMHRGLLGLYPAGGCNAHGEDRPWKKGFAEMALSVPGTQIVVVRLNGTGRLLPLGVDRERWGGKWINRNVDVDVIYSDPITPEEYEGLTAEQLTNYAKDIHDNLVIPAAA